MASTSPYGDVSLGEGVVAAGCCRYASAPVTGVLAPLWSPLHLARVHSDPTLWPEGASMKVCLPTVMPDVFPTFGNFTHGLDANFDVQVGKLLKHGMGRFFGFDTVLFEG